MVKQGKGVCFHVLFVPLISPCCKRGDEKQWTDLRRGRHPLLIYVCSFSRFLSPSLPLCLSFSLPLSLCLFLSRSLCLFLSLSLSLCLSLSPSLCLCLSV